MAANERRQRKKEARAARLEAERKAASRRELRRRILSGVGIGVFVAIVLLVFSNRSQDTALPGTYEAFRSQPTACGADQPDPITPMTFDAPQPQGIEPTDMVQALIETSCGDVVIQLDPAASPETVNSFVFLARQGFYDGSAIHRVVSDFVIQGGDPEGSGRGGPGYDIADEYPPDGFVYEPGVVAMANAGRGTTGSQFFFVIGPDASFLGPTFNVLGRVVSGNDVLDRIAGVETARPPQSREQSLPLESVYLDKVTIDIVG